MGHTGQAIMIVAGLFRDMMWNPPIIDSALKFGAADVQTIIAEHAYHLRRVFPDYRCAHAPTPPCVHALHQHETAAPQVVQGRNQRDSGATMEGDSYRSVFHDAEKVPL
jgi:hypothetical protein